MSLPSEPHSNFQIMSFQTLGNKIVGKTPISYHQIKKDLSRVPLSPNFNVDSSFLWRKMHYLLRTSTLKVGKRGQQTNTVVFWSVKLGIQLGREKSHFESFPNQFCRRVSES